MRKTLTGMPKVGDTIYYVGESYGDLTRGTGYVVRGIDADGDVIIFDDDGCRDFINPKEFANFEIETDIPEDPGYFMVDVKTPQDSEGISFLHVYVDEDGLKTLLDLEARHLRAKKAKVLQEKIAELQKELKEL